MLQQSLESHISVFSFPDYSSIKQSMVLSIRCIYRVKHSSTKTGSRWNPGEADKHGCLGEIVPLAQGMFCCGWHNDSQKSKNPSCIWRHDQKAACWPAKSKVLIFVETTQGRKLFHWALTQKAFVTIVPLRADLMQLHPLYLLSLTETRFHRN